MTTIIEFINKNKNRLKYFESEIGFVPFEFLIDKGSIKIDCDFNKPLKEIHLKNEIICSEHFYPLKMTATGLMVENYNVVYSIYGEVMIFFLL